MEGTSWDANQKRFKSHFQFIKDTWNISAILNRRQTCDAGEEEEAQGRIGLLGFRGLKWLIIDSEGRMWEEAEKKKVEMSFVRWIIKFLN